MLWGGNVDETTIFTNEMGTNNSAMVDEQKWRETVHYINGPETLPAPLSAEEEAKVMENIRNNVEGAREPLITHNLRLVVYISKKFESSFASVEDLISIGTIGLIKSS